MQNLTHAHNELFRRHPDERFASLTDLWQHCQDMKQWSTIKWVPPAEFSVEDSTDGLSLQVQGQPMSLTDWSFTQLCSLTGVSKDTVNRLSPDTVLVQRELDKSAGRPRESVVGQTMASSTPERCLSSACFGC